jgi:ribonuclease III
MHKLLIFNDEQLLRRALTHQSYVNENPDEPGDNERLEFLGDAILNFISGEYLYQLRPEIGEDEMTLLRSALVDKKQLSDFAIAVGLGPKMRLGQGDIQKDGRQNPRLLSNTFEAIVGAYYLDHNRDIAALRPLITELFDEIIPNPSKDPKNQLQEFAQANSAMLLRYVTEKIGGTDHAPEFIARVYSGSELWGEGRGSSKKEAEKQAAENALAWLKERGLL